MKMLLTINILLFLLNNINAKVFLFFSFFCIEVYLLKIYQIIPQPMLTVTEENLREIYDIPFTDTRSFIFIFWLVSRV